MSPPDVTGAPVVVVVGAEDVIVRERVVQLVEGAVGDGDRAMMVEEVVLPAAEHASDDTAGIAEVVGTVVAAASTPPFLTDRRVVVARGCAVLSTKDSVAALVQYLADPLPTTTLVLVWDLPPGAKVRRSSPPKSLVEAVAACGGVVEQHDPVKQKNVGEWVRERCREEPYKLSADAIALLSERIGEKPDALVGQLVTLRGIFAEGQRVSAEDIEPFLVQSGGVPPWIVTDAISKGDPAAAIVALQRMLGPGERHPLQVLASLTTYVLNLLAIDGSGVANRQQAIKLLGGPPKVAEGALVQSKRLGSDRVAELVQLVADADLDVRGRQGLPAETVMEILVARMASRSKLAGRRN